jgi:hypothetical protein
LKVDEYITDRFNGEGETAKRDFARWRQEWREAEAVLKARKGTSADYFNRLQPALDGKAKQMALECADRADPYQEAINRLHRSFGDEVELALDHLKKIRDPEKALYAAEQAWGRFADMEPVLQKRGLSLQDVLWQKAVLNILPDELEGQKRWDQWVKEQAKAYSQAQATRSENSIKKGKKESITYPPNHLAAEKESVTYLPNLTAERKVTYLMSSLPEFHQALCFRRDEVKRFLKETAESFKADPGAVAFHAKATVEAGGGCVKCGEDATHTSDRCAKIGTMASSDWRDLAGDLCIRCGLHRYVKGQKCTYRCGKCGENHMTGRHGIMTKKKREAGSKGGNPRGPPAKRPRREGPPPAAPRAYHANAYPPPPPSTDLLRHNSSRNMALLLPTPDTATSRRGSCHLRLRPVLPRPTKDPPRPLA